jgi:hypothetical protein
MHQPPAVSVSVRASRWTGRLLTMCLLLGGIQTALYFSRNALNTWQSQLLVVGLVVSLGLVYFLIRRREFGDLQWTGDAWQWSAFPLPGNCSLRLHLDFQSLMLISLQHPHDTTVWLWLERGQTTHHWLALRRAIVHTVSAPSRQHHLAAGATTASLP